MIEIVHLTHAKRSTNSNLRHPSPFEQLIGSVEAWLYPVFESSLWIQRSTIQKKKVPEERREGDDFFLRTELDQRERGKVDAIVDFFKRSREIDTV